MNQQATQKVVRTRFAPSPTGYLHIGGARTALFSWLFARQNHGIFVLRIEDTDLERSTEASVQAIFDGLEWLGIDFDEGPYYQTKRLARYQEVAGKMLAEGKAYRCYCSKERLQQLREQQTAQKLKPRYDGCCRELHIDDPLREHVIRFRNPTEGEVSFTDFVRGEISVKNSELDDLVLVRSDGMPTYNFAVVVDDFDMQISHVIRGDDHINNTPRQINIMQVLGHEPPQFGHVPMILGSDGKRLSKRHGAVSVLQYREEGYLPEALINCLVRLGWSYRDQEIFSREEMIQYFNPANIQRAAAAFDPNKLIWMNQHYLKSLDPVIISHSLAQQLQQRGVPINHGPSLVELVKAQAERCKTLHEMAERSHYFFVKFDHYDEKASKKFLTLESLPMLMVVKKELHELADWCKETIHDVINGISTRKNWSLGQIAQPLRVAVTGNTISPPIDVTLWLLGKQQTCVRLEDAISWILEQHPQAGCVPE